MGQGVVAPLGRQRGSLLVYLGLAIVALGLVYLLTKWVDDNLVTAAGRRAGAAELRQDYVSRDAKALKEAEAVRDKALKEKSEAEAAMVAAVGEASANYDKGKADGKTELDAALARVRAGRGLRDPGRTGCPAERGSGAGKETAGAAGRSDAVPGAFLSQAAAEFLLGLAGEADDVARQLGACQAVILADRL
jgi:hypothetical protein